MRLAPFLALTFGLDHLAADGLEAVPELIRIVMNTARGAERQKYTDRGGRAPGRRRDLAAG